MYRIKERRNKFTHEIGYEIQIKVLWWWSTCENGLEDCMYTDREMAYKVLHKLQTREGWH